MPGRTLPPDTPTEQAHGLVDDAITALRKHAAEQRRLSLVVHHHEGTETAPLDPGQPVIVGRRPPATLCVPSGKLSRAHARFTLDHAGRVTVEDLGSTNGTWVRGAQIKSADVALGEEVIVGDALAFVQPRAPAESAVSASRGGGADAPIAAAPAMRELLETAARVAGSSVPVILHGETGSGKEVVARFLHERSPRARGPLVSVNCAAIPHQLVESTLFGHEKGAFTGAAARQKGVFEEADGGTVFLDEIGELPAAAQAALLRVLETGRFSRVGSPKEIAVDVRVIAATHRDLEAARDAGAFRADLYYRLGVVVITVPPLRDRALDIEPLVRRFVESAGGGRIRGVSADALTMLRQYAWPGNVRELRNTIERAAVLARTDVIRPEDLPSKIREGAAARPPMDGAPAAAGDLRARVTDYEARLIEETLAATSGNQSEAARRLGMPIRTLSHKVKVLGLKKPSR